MPTSRNLLTRWAGSLTAALVFLAWLLVMAGLFVKFGVVNHLIKDGVQDPIMIRFALKALFSEILPIYLGIGLVQFVVAMALAKAFRLWTPAKDGWSFKHAFVGTLGLMGFTHAWMWWQVPTTLWVFLGLSALPMGLALALIFGLCLWALLYAMGWSGDGKPRKGLVAAAWILLSWGSYRLPQVLEQRIWTSGGPAGHPARMVMISLDGLRQDTAMQDGFARAHGFKSFNAYAALPATRLEWSILWGGDPRHYSVGNLIPSIDELEGKVPYEILEAAKAKGLKARFYIDDGGTVGLTDRTASFDEVGMPAAGWENFLNSNLAVHLPLYAAWMNVLRVFPTTTPWTPLDLGMRAALERGRGADWVMYHSCLAHQPIFLNRSELASVPGWWKLPSGRMAPLWETPSASQERAWRPEYGPFLAYQIRVKDILDHWIALWNQLPSDPDYGPADRLLMTDHGERFYHATDDIQFGGVHGYNLDPWEARIPLCFDGPGLPDGEDSTKALSLLWVRDLVAARVLNGTPIQVPALLARDEAPLRMHALNFAVRSNEPKDYREMDTSEIIQGTRIFPDGVWVTRYKADLAAREQDLTYAEAQGHIFVLLRPLKQGGARVFTYKDYELIQTQEIDEAAFKAQKERIDKLFMAPWNEKGSPANP